ncbi:MAG TPA: triphosphoribosyl-dephospho-CoA synthase MdcB [Casimicrobiaceae bacterium]
MIARAATRSLWRELVLYPKPGLVSLRDGGAHPDMDAATFVRSLFALSRYWSEIAQAGAIGAPFDILCKLGIRAESRMLDATGGVNTHRGAIFALGLLCAAAARTDANGEMPDDATLRRVLIAHWGAALTATQRSALPLSNGMRVRRRYGIGGARDEARRAFPAVFDIALPALRGALVRGCDTRRAGVSALFALLACVDDTNILHRGGPEGLAFVRRRAREFRDAGDVHASDALARAETIHREFVARRLSPGGCADLLAAALFVHTIQQTSR